jgi:hypothetical protein
MTPAAIGFYCENLEAVTTTLNKNIDRVKSAQPKFNQPLLPRNDE